ncbi:MAG: hypothetical protein HYT78_11895 [Deltaproteobacteria bacterium]|nr:hypothetical protein [Deltaproteobacteria bacterium]
MIEFAKLIHAAIGTDSSWSVAITFALIAAALFGLLGWMVNAAYISSLPRFDIRMDSANFGAPGPPYDPNKYTLVVLVVSVSNSRSQSIAKDWNLFVKTPAKEFKRATPVPMGETLELKSSDPGSTKIYRQENALYLNTATKPIQPGDGVTGVLPYLVEDTTISELARPETTFRLTAVDAFGKEHENVKTRAQFVSEIHFPVIKDR